MQDAVHVSETLFTSASVSPEKTAYSVSFFPPALTAVTASLSAAHTGIPAAVNAATHAAMSLFFFV